MNTIFSVLEGKKIKLRPLEPEDVDTLYAWENDPEIWEVSETVTPFSKSLLQKYIKNLNLDIYQSRQLRLMIDVKKTNGALMSIGTIDLFEFEPIHSRIGLGILIKHQKDRRHGYASEALCLVKEYVFKKLLVHQIFCNIPVDNKPSLNLFQKFGFKIIGEKIEWIKTPTGWKNEYILQLINPYGH